MELSTEDRIEEVSEAVKALDGRLVDVERMSTAAKDVRILLALVADPAGCTARVAELEQIVAAAKEAQANTAKAKVAHAEWCTKTLAFLDEREAALAEREKAIERREAQVAGRWAFIQANRRYLPRVEPLPGGGTHDLGSDEPQGGDPHYHPAQQSTFQPSDDQAITEPVPGQIGGAVTLTRTIHSEPAPDGRWSHPRSRRRQRVHDDEVSS
jgi:hypothetical protein